MQSKMTKSTVLLLLAVIVAVQAHVERSKRQAYGAGGYNDGYNGAAPYRPPPPPPQQQQYQQQSGAYKPQPQQYSQGEEKQEGPHPLQKLLENSKFECGSKKDGYYADSGVGCQAFHYCVSGQKHSMMCPAGTVFHQVHLNCVPSDQDICSKADKFYFVNDYLYKQLDQRGPNNTVQYHQRYYPEGYAVGDPFVPPQEGQAHGKPQQSYSQPPAYQPKAPAYAPPAPVYHQQQPQSYPRQQPSAPFTPPQQVVYGAPQQKAPVPVYQPQQAAPYNRPDVHQAQVLSSPEQAQALQAHKAAEAAVLAQHYKAQQAQAQYQAQQQQTAAYQPSQYGGAYRNQYGQY